MDNSLVSKFRFGSMNPISFKSLQRTGAHKPRRDTGITLGSIAVAVTAPDDADETADFPVTLRPQNHRSTKAPSPLFIVLLVLAPIILSAAVAFGVASQMQPIYAAQSDILFDLGDRPDVLEKFLATQAVVVRSRAILGPVSRTYNIPVVTLEENLDVDFPKGSVVMRLRYADSNADSAFSVLSSIMDGYVAMMNQAGFLNSPSEVLVPVFTLDDPIWPKPIQAAAVGAVVGLAIAIAWLALGQHMIRRI